MSLSQQIAAAAALLALGYLIGLVAGILHERYRAATARQEVKP